MLLTALAVYALASLAGGLAVTPSVLIGSRVAQRLGGALLFPATLALLQTSFTDVALCTKAFAWWGTAGASGAIVGAMLGGLLTGWLGWESVFFVNIPVCLLAAAGTLTLLAPDAPPAGASGGFGLGGALGASAGCTALLYGLISAPESQWRAPLSLGAIAAGAVMLTVFAVRQRFATHPLAPPRLLRVRSLATAIAVIFVFQGAINMLHYVFFLHLQNVLGYHPWQAGLALLPMSVLAMLGANRLLPFVTNRFGVRAALGGGMLGVGTSMVLLAMAMSVSGSYWALLPAVVVWGLAAGTLYPAMFLAAGQEVPAAQQGIASGLNQTSAQLGGAIGLAVLIAVASAGRDLSPAAAGTAAQIVSGTRLAALTGGLAVVAGAFLAFALPRDAPSQPAHQPS